MEALTTLTDSQRLEALNTIYKKGLTTAKEELAFSADKLIYLKPFLNKLQSEVEVSGTAITSISMVRQVIDELLWDIWEEVEASCARNANKKAEKIALEYGLQSVANQIETDFYYANKVA